MSRGESSARKSLGYGRGLTRRRQPLVYGRKRGPPARLRRQNPRQTESQIESTSTGDRPCLPLAIPLITASSIAEPSLASEDTYYYTPNNIAIDPSPHVINPGVMEQPRMAEASAGQEHHPIGQTDFPMITSRTPTTHFEMLQAQHNRVSAGETGHQNVSTPGTGQSQTFGGTSSQETIPVAILDYNAGRFQNVVAKLGGIFDLSVIYPQTLRAYRYEPQPFPEGEGMVLETAIGPTRFNRFVRIPVKFGTAEASIEDMLVFDDGVSYDGVDIFLGNRFMTRRVTHNSPVGAVSGSRIFAPLNAIVSSTPEDILPFAGWSQNQAPSDTIRPISAFPERTQNEIFSSHFPSDHIAGEQLNNLDDNGLLFPVTQSDEIPSTFISQKPMLHGLHTPQPQQFKTFLDTAAGADETQTVPSTGPLPTLGALEPNHTFDGGFDDMDGVFDI